MGWSGNNNGKAPIGTLPRLRHTSATLVSVWDPDRSFPANGYDAVSSLSSCGVHRSVRLPKQLSGCARASRTCCTDAKAELNGVTVDDHSRFSNNLRSLSLWPAGLFTGR